jgi:glutathione synthase/RimK-type ligase-like ATP-grasp enzyme
MKKIVGVNNPLKWDWEVPDVEIVSSKDYLLNPRFLSEKDVRIFNLCNEYRYQSKGYYVSLIAEARGHKALPDIKHLLDLKGNILNRKISEELEKLILKSLRKIRSSKFILSIYFGRNLAKQYEELSRELHKFIPAPFIRAKFVFNKKWILQSIRAIPYNDIPVDHEPYVKKFAREYFTKKRYHKQKIQKALYDLAILVNPDDPSPPSDKQALEMFVQAGEKMQFNVDLITKSDFHRIPTYDALFIRTTTHVQNDTYQFSRLAESEGLAVIDSPESILKCSNKVFLFEALQNGKVPIPKTVIVHQDNKKEIEQTIGLPCVLKLPDSAFSMGVSRADTPQELDKMITSILSYSDLVIAQEYSYSEFDWRIGVLDGMPLFACKYFMAMGHWQIYNWTKKEELEQYGDFACLPLAEVPPDVIKYALKSTSLLGKGLYGVDLKEIDGRVIVIEVNDNPNIDRGVEDQILKENLYQRIIQAFRNRIEARLGIRNGK